MFGSLNDLHFLFKQLNRTSFFSRHEWNEFLEIINLWKQSDDNLRSCVHLEGRYYSLKNCRLTIQIRGIRSTERVVHLRKIHSRPGESPRDICWRRLFSSSLNRQPWFYDRRPCQLHCSALCTLYSLVLSLLFNLLVHLATGTFNVRPRRYTRFDQKVT